MIGIDNSFGSFEMRFKDGGEAWYLTIHPEMYPASFGIKPSGNYHVFCIHPVKGSCCFIIEQDENCSWFCANCPPFISTPVVQWIGNLIENRSR